MRLAGLVRLLLAHPRIGSMPPRCSVCSHPERVEIDAAIIAGGSLRNIAQRFDGPSAWSIYRHTKHAQATLLAGITAREAVLAELLRTELEELLDREVKAGQEHVHTFVGTLYQFRYHSVPETG